MKALRVLLALCLLSAVAVNAISSDRKVFTPLRAEAIPTDEVSDMIQDADGFIWIVTYKGLVRYDGFETVCYSLNSLDGEAFECQFQTVAECDGQIYIGTDKGLFRMSKEDGTIAPVRDNSVSRLNISAFAKDAIGRLWVGADKGLFVKSYGADSFSAVELVPSEGKAITDITDLLIDPEDNLWITSWERGLFRLNIQSGRIYPYTHGALNRSNVLHFDPAGGGLWIGTWGNGLLHIKDSDIYTDSPSYTQYLHKPYSRNSVLDDVIYDIAEGPDGEIWVGGRSGLTILEKDSDGKRRIFRNFTSGPVNTSLPYNEVNSILRTEENTMWLGMYGGGVCKAGSSLPPYEALSLDKVREAYKTSTVESICRTDENTFWFGIGGHGLIKYEADRERFTNYREIRGFSGFPNSPTVENLLLCRNGNDMVIGNYNAGAWIYNTKTGHTRIISTATFANLPSNRISALAEESNGNIWICTNEGTCVLDTLLNLKEIGPYKVNDVDFDSDGNVWLASISDGIVKIGISDDSHKRIGTESFNSILIDSKGRIWAGSLWNGLQVFDPSQERFIPITSLDFLNGRQICNIDEDPYGHIWVTTNNLVVSLTFDGLTPSSVGFFRDISDSYESSSFSMNASMYLPENDRMAFAYSRGLAMFPCSVQAEPGPGRDVAFTDFIINDISYKDTDQREIHKDNLPLKDINYTDEFKLGRGQKDIKFKFSILDFARPSSDIFHYRLRKAGEKDAQWIITNGSRNEASFRNLRPGRYVFEVFGYRPGMEGQSNIRRINIHVLKSRYLAWYAILGYVMFMLFIGCSVILFQRSRRRKEELQLKRKLVFDVKDVDYTSEDEAFLQRAIGIVNANLSNEDFSLGDFAQAMAVSRDVLTERLKALSSYTPSAFVTNIRMTTAYKLINRKEKIKVADLAYSVGFNDPKYFSKKFKLKYGKTPKELMDEMTKND